MYVTLKAYEYQHYVSWTWKDKACIAKNLRGLTIDFSKNSFFFCITYTHPQTHFRNLYSSMILGQVFEGDKDDQLITRTLANKRARFNTEYYVCNMVSEFHKKERSTNEE